MKLDWECDSGDKISHVYLDLTPEHWFQLCVRGQPFHLGGACDNMDKAQELLNGMFHGAPWASVYSLRNWYDLVRTEHRYCFENFPDPGSEKDTNPIARLLYICENSHMDKWDVSLFKSPPREGVMGALHTLYTYSWPFLMTDFYTRNPKNASASWAKQREFADLVNRSDYLVRMLPALKTLNDHLHEWDPGPLEGCALVELKDDGTKRILYNRQGPTFYSDRDEAERWLALYHKHKDPIADKLIIVPAQMSVDEGLIFLEN